MSSACSYGVPYGIHSTVGQADLSPVRESGATLAQTSPLRDPHLISAAGPELVLLGQLTITFSLNWNRFENVAVAQLLIYRVRMNPNGSQMNSSMARGQFTFQNVLFD